MTCCVVASSSSAVAGRKNSQSRGARRAGNKVVALPPRSVVARSTSSVGMSSSSSSSSSSSTAQTLMSRRAALSLALASAAFAGAASISPSTASAATSSSSATAPSLVLTEQEWRKRLTPEEFDVMRGYGTEKPFSSPLVGEKRSGVFVCKGCGSKLFSSRDKYDAGTGWPSFSAVVSPEAVVESEDARFGLIRTAVNCFACGSHLGHVFADGPEETTGLRYCINGIALKFEPGPEA